MDLSAFTNEGLADWRGDVNVILTGHYEQVVANGPDQLSSWDVKTYTMLLRELDAELARRAGGM